MSRSKEGCRHPFARFLGLVFLFSFFSSCPSLNLHAEEEQGTPRRELLLPFFLASQRTGRKARSPASALLLLPLMALKTSPTSPTSHPPKPTTPVPPQQQQQQQQQQQRQRPPPHQKKTADSITCSLLGAQLRSGPCGGLQDSFKTYAAKYANADCATIDAAKAELQKSEPSLACCSQLRQFASNGCTCDRVTASLASAVLGGGGDTRAAIAGGVRLAQASRCSLPENGGPITDTCTGSTGCPRKA